MTAPTDRPNPLAKAAQNAASLATAIHGILGAAVAFGLLTGAQSEAIDATGQALPGWLLALGTIAGAVFPVLAAVQAAFTTAKTAKGDVTPVADPRDHAGRALTPDVIA